MTLIAEAHGHVHGGVTGLFAALLVGLILCLALEEKIHAKKSLIAGVFAIVCLLLGGAMGILPFGPIFPGEHDVQFPQDKGPVEIGDVEITDAEELQQRGPLTVHDDPVRVGGHSFEPPVFILGIDWAVIGIILGSSLLVDVVSKSGLFTWIAIKVTKATGGDPLKLLVAYGVMTVVFSAVLNNVTAMIIVGSLTAVSLEKLGRKDKLLGFLLIEGLLTNVGGMLTLISSVPNIIVGTAAGISFVEFFLRASPFVLLGTIVTLVMGAWLFDIRRLATDEQREEAARLVAGFDETDGIESWGFFYFSAMMTVLFIITIAMTSELPVFRELGMSFVALGFAGVMLIRYKASVDKFYQALDWDLIGFFAALFVVINVMEHALVLDKIGELLQPIIAWGDVGGTAALLVASAVFSSVTDNIPLAAMLAKILTGLGTPADSPLWWAVVFGANLGGNITPIGSASTLVAVTIMHKHKLPMSFGGFVKAAAPYAVVQIVLATAYVLLVLR